MHFRKIVLFFFSLFSLYGLSAQEKELLVRYPAISPNGNEIAFSYQGDIWTVASTGGRAQRLTIHESYETRPSWSPSGDWIAFEGNRHTNNDIFVIDRNGQNLKRKTYHSGQDVAPSWGANGSLCFNSRRLWQQTERNPEIFGFVEGMATEKRMLGGMGANPAPHPGGDFVAFERGWCRVVREAYRGSANRDIWIWHSKSDTYTKLTDFDGQDHMPVWGDNNRLYFLSARNGRYNIYYIQFTELKGKPVFEKPRAVTDFTDEGIRSFHVNASGDLVYTMGNGGIYLKKSGDDQARLLVITAPSDFRFYPQEKMEFTSGVRDFSVSPNEKNIVFNVRGEIFVTRNDKDKKRTVNISDHPFRDQEAGWLNDSTLIFISDRDGLENLYLAASSDANQTDIYLSLKTGIKRITDTEDGVNSYVLSPDKKRIAMRIGRGRLDVGDIDAKGKISSRKTLLDGWDSPSGVSWSPDGQWLAYSLSDLDFNSEVYIHKADGKSEPVNVSMHPRGDGSPYWSPDGSKLGFLSDRSNMNQDVWFVWLKEEDYQRTQLARELEEETESKEDKKEKTVKPVTIDLKDIHRRLVRVTSQNGNEGSLLIGPKGEYFYYTTNNGGRITGTGDRSLMKVKWDGSDETLLVKDFRAGGLEWDKKGKSIYHVSRGRLAVLDVDKKKSEARPFEATMTIDHPRERQQILDEAWRALNSGFYDPNFHGQDWKALKEKYSPRVLKASTSQDFRDMANEMLGQLNASHMGLYGTDPEDTQTDRTGYLGIEVEPEKDGVVISRKIRHSPSDRKNSMLYVGDRIRMVNGQEVNSTANFWELLDSTGNDLIYLQVSGKGGNREVVIEPASSLRSAIYQDWVDECRRLTDEYSGGQLGYIHIQGMNWPSFEVFERELTASAHGKKGLIIDVRNNGGGWTTDMVMAILNNKQHSYTVPRGATDDLKNHPQFRDNYPFGERLPFPHIKIPTIAMCNEGSYSNAEIFSHAYKALDHGTLVGTPTFGAVISTGAQGLIDGSRVRMPFRAWYVRESGMNMENNPATPDIIVEQAPDAKEKKNDPQLKRAVEELLRTLD